MVRVDSATLAALDAARGEHGRGAQIRLILQAALDTEPAKPKKLRRVLPGERPRARGEVAGLVFEFGRAVGALLRAANALRRGHQRPDLHASVEGLIVEFERLRERLDDFLTGEDRA